MTVGARASLFALVAELPLAMLLLLPLLVCVVGAEASKTNQVDELQQRHLSQLPDFFNFQKFKSIFNKSYASPAEHARREMHFLARAFRAFVSAFGFKYMRRPYYLALNSRSDWTPAELEATLMHEDEFEAQLLEARAKVETIAPPPPAQPVALEPGELGRELELIERHASESMFSRLARELRALYHTHLVGASNSSAPKSASSVHGGTEQAADAQGERVRAKFDIERAAGLLRYENYVGSSAKHELEPTPTSQPGNNANYRGTQPDWRNEMDFFEHPEHKPVYYRWPISGEGRTEPAKLGLERHNVGVGLLNSFREALLKLVNGDSELNEQVVSDERLADVVFVDHSKGGCMFEAQDQGSCGSCYAFAAIAYLEWAHCMETKRLEKFSEQYVVDCGRRQGGMRGCRSGKITSIAEFVQNFGLELERHYPYVAREQQCPYPMETPFESMGYLRLQLDFVLRVPLELMEHYLSETPMVVSMAIGSDFSEYGGGIDSGSSCGRRGTHSMLLVGHGRQDRREYWLIRNSFSTDFGERGYYKLDKRTGSNCFRPAEGFVYGRNEQTVGAPRLFPRRNPNVPKPIKLTLELPRPSERNETATSNLLRREIGNYKARELKRQLDD